MPLGGIQAVPRLLMADGGERAFVGTSPAKSKLIYLSGRSDELRCQLLKGRCAGYLEKRGLFLPVMISCAESGWTYANH